MTERRFRNDPNLQKVNDEQLMDSLNQNTMPSTQPNLTLSTGVQSGQQITSRVDSQKNPPNEEINTQSKKKLLEGSLYLQCKFGTESRLVQFSLRG